ncbi:acetolactate synthase large subunit [Siminovitchia acidinfaciens]|uniref:Acetolactate synthase large subunit n=1 Tax=Siminovitchia acidinfaciens TaxID=2321395 RepID=A0A429Y6B7_9BACI|nr:acetolactate synthase large subunit [Siminovitchia acidinfaciens]RST76999.1 acetolactate synthase large subunit [Siminovitchia acidinfaciens]
MKATDVLVQCLENEGVEYVFGIVGKETLDLVESISRSDKIKYIPVRHEQGAAFMATVYGKLTKSPGVCTATLGPGAGNLLTGLATATLDGLPVVAITGQAGLDRQHKHSHQFIEMTAVMRPATKWSVQIKDADTIPEIVRKAFITAGEEKPGAVFLEFPENLAIEAVPPKVLPIPEKQHVMPAPQTIQLAISCLNQSQRPFVIIGDKVIRQNACQEANDFISKLQAPVTHSFMAKGVIPKEAPNNYFTFGFNENDLVLSGIDEADLLVVIGFDTIEKLPKEWNRMKTPILHIDSQPPDPDEYYPVAVEIIGHLNQTLPMLNASDDLVKSWSPSGNLKPKIEQTYQIGLDFYDTTSRPLSVENILHVIEMLSPENAVVLSDVGAHKLAIARTYQPKRPGNLIISNGLASMGIAIPGSIGARLARPNDPVICITGDGGALMTLSELETAKRIGVPIVIIVLNDGVLKLEQQMMKKKLGKSVGVSFENPDFVLLAESFGIKGLRPQSLEEFEKMFQAAISSRELILFDMPMPQS